MVRRILWLLSQMVIAALLLTIDQRLFLFYAFMTLLVLLTRVDQLRATQRLLACADEPYRLLLMRHAGITPEEWSTLLHTMLQARKAFPDGLNRDAKLYTPFDSFEDWLIAPVASQGQYLQGPVEGGLVITE